MANRIGIEANLRLHYPAVAIVRNGKQSSAEFGGELPRRFVSALREGGAEVSVYRHRGVVSTVVSY